MTKIQLRKRFYSALRRGTGEAWIIRTEHPELRLTDLVIKACLKLEADDPQMQGTRAGFLMNFYRADGAPERIRGAILGRLAASDANSWDNLQLMELATCLWDDGDDEARRVLTQFYDRTPVDNYGKGGDAFIIYANGFDGFLAVAKKHGHSIRSGGESRENWWLQAFEEKFPEQGARARLESLAKGDADIAAFLTPQIDAGLPASCPKQRRGYDYIRQRIDIGTLWIVTAASTAELRDDELERLAQEAMSERDPKRLTDYLRVFAQRRFPAGPEFLIRIVKATPEKSGRLLIAASNALAHFTAPAIRDLALRRITRSRWPAYYTGLLERNFEPADAILLAELLEKRNHYKYIHSLVYSVLDIFNANPGPHCKGPLELLYDKMNCGLHRADVVNMLGLNNVLEARIRAELPYDAAENVRELAVRYPA